jgi:hypothetical protein
MSDLNIMALMFYLLQKMDFKRNLNSRSGGRWDRWGQEGR